MFGLVLVVHIVVCLILIGIILIQGGRGGLSETLSGATAQSIFGSGVANVLTRVTGGVAIVFAATCLTLAYLSTLRGRSVLEQVPETAPQALPFMPSPESSGSQPSASTPAPPAAPAATAPSVPELAQ